MGKKKKMRRKNNKNNEKNLIQNDYKKEYKAGIIKNLQNSSEPSKRKRSLMINLKSTHYASRRDFNAAVSELCREGLIYDLNGMVGLCSRAGFFTGVITKLNRTFGFAERIDDKTQVFIPGKFLYGAIPGDKVLISLIESKSGSPEGKVINVIEETESGITGVAVREFGGYYLIPDTMSRRLIRISAADNAPFKEDDKVLAKIISRGKRHSEHIVQVVMSFGNAGNAASCAEAIIASGNIPQDFSENALEQARKIEAGGISCSEYADRQDLRGECIFTIDGADAKDLDDAVSIEKYDKYYMLGVHIADVSYYVKGSSALDNEALKRGTSVYYANKVIPMLPKELSNGICSLNPNEDRLTFSVFIKVDFTGEICSYSFKKTIISSKLKGVYSEINSLLDQDENAETLKSKYEPVWEKLLLMNELADLLTEKRRKRGSPQFTSAETKLILDENDCCIDVIPRITGKSESVIEEFMLLANECAAKFAREKEIPFVYRIHEPPSLKKTERFKEMLSAVNISYPNVAEFSPKHYAQILKKAENTPLSLIINNIALRSMSKARYLNEPAGHFGLVLKDYAHFTSPIRRYPDLAIHRILTDAIAGADSGRMEKRYAAFVLKAAEQSSAAEINAAFVECECENCYKAEYMRAHLGETFDGIISSVTEYGFYVTLPNMIEGLVHINSLPDGEYSFDSFMAITERLSNKRYALGDDVRVICIKTSISSGEIDFKLSD